MPYKLTKVDGYSVRGRLLHPCWPVEADVAREAGPRAGGMVVSSSAGSLDGDQAEKVAWLVKSVLSGAEQPPPA